MIRLYVKLLIIFIMLLIESRALADAYDPLLLRAQASIFPKIILLDKDLDYKLINNTIIITIVSMERDIDASGDLQKYILLKHGDTLGNKKLIVNTITYKEFNPDDKATSYILLKGSEELLKSIIDHASKNKNIVFSYKYTDFKYNSLISLLVKEKTYIYFNKSAIPLYGIRFSPVFYKITKLIE